MLSENTYRKFTEEYDVNDYEVLTEEGWKDIINTKKTINYEVYKITLSNGMYLECADTHILIDKDYNEVYAKDTKGIFLRTTEGLFEVTNVQNLNYEEEMYDLEVDSPEHTYYTNNILSHNSVTIGTYLLWKALFTPNIIIGIAANKSSTAREILDKIKKIFVNLPIWMQSGLTVWNKGSIELENGTKILTDSTNGDSFRGYTVHIVVVDEAAFIRHSMWEEFSDSIFPAQSALSWKQTILVSTANGLNHFRNIVVGGRREDGTSLPGKNGYSIFEVSWREVPRYNKDGSVQNPEDFKADIIRKYGDMYFQQNYGNKFLGSSNTLIEAEVLEVLEHEEPELLNKIFSGLRIYEEPEEGHHYVITVDPKKDGIDDMGIQVMDVTGIPFRQVASANLTESYLTAPGKIFDLGMYYNEGIIIVENNLDQTIVDTLFYHYEYENIYKERGKKVQGFRTTTRTKKQILSFMKKFIEENKVILRDKITIEQLYSFIEKSNGSFSAEEGYKDDMVMALALVWGLFLEVKNFDDFVGMVDLINAQKKAEDAEQESFAEFFDLGFSDDIDDSMFSKDIETFNGFEVHDQYREPDWDMYVEDDNEL